MDSRTPGKAQQKIPFFSRLQVKYAMSYLAILAVVLVLLNTYPLIASQNLLFSSKRDSLKNQAAVMASALMELESLNADQVARVMNMLDSTGLSRVLVTDPSGLILYDSLAQSNSEEESEGSQPDAQPEEEYRYALFQEVVLALEGNDVVYSQYQDGRFLSTAACPIVYRGMTIGAIYLTEEDTTQGALLMNLQQNLRSISLVLVAIALTISFLFSKVLTSRIGALLGAIRIVGEGEYGHRLQPSGKDELAHLAEEFNQLTARLQTTEEIRRRFVSDASHELKTPLASIRLLADSILQNQEMDAETVRDFVGDIGDEAERLTRITEHLLALTRLDSLPVGETQIVDMAQVAQRAINMLTPVAEAADVTVEANWKPGCTLRCTEDDLYQICFNLMENAIKYNLPGGDVTVRVETRGEQSILSVADTGIGIPEEELPHVKYKFYKGSSKARGSGIGLAVCEEIVTRHEGTLDIGNAEGGGCLVTLRLPIET